MLVKKRHVNYSPIQSCRYYREIFRVIEPILKLPKETASGGF
jgi:hypothetical protein